MGTYTVVLVKHKQTNKQTDKQIHTTNDQGACTGIRNSAKFPSALHCIKLWDQYIDKQWDDSA